MDYRHGRVVNGVGWRTGGNLGKAGPMMDDVKPDNADSPANDGPLNGIRVVEVATVLAGPLAGQIMGDFGAEVIKIEHPDGG